MIGHGYEPTEELTDQARALLGAPPPTAHWNHAAMLFDRGEHLVAELEARAFHLPRCGARGRFRYPARPETRRECDEFEEIRRAKVLPR
jgi:hypothetical protein